jgi:hypothetical protein
MFVVSYIQANDVRLRRETESNKTGEGGRRKARVRG